MRYHTTRRPLMRMKALDRAPSTPGHLASVLSRRRLLKIGFLGPLGLARPAFGEDKGVAGRPSAATFGRAKRCILVFLNGGPSQLDTWDMKPDATAEVRGELHPIRTAGFQGRRFDPLVIEGEKHTAQFCAPEVELPTAMTPARLVRRGRSCSSNSAPRAEVGQRGRGDSVG